MTASLPTFRLRALEELCQRIHRRPLQRIDGPADLERLPRYQWRDPITSTDDALAEIGKGHHANNKVLWVSNTVERAISAARLSQGLGDTLLYHSRFRYVDRVKKHGNVIDAFRSRVITERIIACTTQVAEMSLDLSADLLITDLAPIPAMIQRLGRLNRRSHPDAPASIKKFIVLRPNTFLPYRQEQLDEAEQWLHELQGRDLSQLDLTSAWKQPETGLASRCASAWLDGGFCTSSEPLREASVGITVIRHEDRERVLSGQSKPNEVAIPMNRPPQGTNWLAWERSRETGHFPICPENALLYDEKEGARWAK